VKLEVKGVDVLLERLAKLRKTELKAAIRKGSRAGCKIIAARVQASVPRRSGRGARAYKVRALPRSRKWTGAKVTAKVAGEPAFYLGFLELGTVERKTKTGANRGRIVARHFERDAALECKEAAAAAVIDALTAALEKAGR
jgi:HK97 gp10 family phage protein